MDMERLRKCFATIFELNKHFKYISIEILKKMDSDTWYQYKNNF